MHCKGSEGMRDPLDEFEEYDRKQNDTTGVPKCVICEEPIFDREYIEYDQQCCHCDDDCCYDFFKQYMIRDFTYNQ